MHKPSHGAMHRKNGATGERRPIRTEESSTQSITRHQHAIHEVALALGMSSDRGPLTEGNQWGTHHRSAFLLTPLCLDIGVPGCNNPQRLAIGPQTKQCNQGKFEYAQRDSHQSSCKRRDNIETRCADHSPHQPSKIGKHLAQTPPRRRRETALGNADDVYPCVWIQRAKPH